MSFSICSCKFAKMLRNRYWWQVCSTTCLHHFVHAFNLRSILRIKISHIYYSKHLIIKHISLPNVIEGLLSTDKFCTSSFYQTVKSAIKVDFLIPVCQDWQSVMSWQDLEINCNETLSISICIPEYAERYNAIFSR